MSPRDLDTAVLQARLGTIQDLLADLANVGDVSVERLEGDRMLRHGCERILTQMIELAVSINGHVAATVLNEASKDYRSSFALALEAGLIEADLDQRLRPSVGLRDVLTHEYVSVDLSIVAHAITSARRDYGEYVEQVAAWLRGREVAD